MATITLEPGESFEHYHTSASETMHVDGSLELSMNGVDSVLTEKQKVSVPANTSHTIKNIGTDTATFYCAGHISHPSK